MHCGKWMKAPAQREGSFKVSTTPTVVFIDDSATMREVIKIAFRRENIDVVTYPDAFSALQQIEHKAPDVVITDVIMPDKDGYEVCQHIKQHSDLNRVPVILMSGVVNRAVAEKAFSVKADELIRKPFQPQDLIARVKHLLQPSSAKAATTSPADAAAALSSIFGTPAQAIKRPVTVAHAAAAPATASLAASGANLAVSSGKTRTSVSVGGPAISAPVTQNGPALAKGTGNGAAPQDIQRLRIEIARLEGLIKKLQSELAAEREYTASLEEHMKTLQES
jgi:CheY-like chemotaxis protein